MHPRDSISWAQRQLAGRHCRKTKEQRKVPPVCACNQNNLCWSSQLSWRKGPGGDTVSASCFSLCRVNGFLRSTETWLNESLRPEHPWTFGKYGFSLECKNFSSDVFLMLFILRKFCSPSCRDHTRCAGVLLSLWASTPRSKEGEPCLPSSWAGFLCHLVLHELQKNACVREGLSLANPGYTLEVSWGKSSCFILPLPSYGWNIRTTF